MLNIIFLCICPSLLWWRERESNRRAQPSLIRELPPIPNHSSFGSQFHHMYAPQEVPAFLQQDLLCSLPEQSQPMAMRSRFNVVAQKKKEVQQLKHNESTLQGDNRVVNNNTIIPAVTIPKQRNKPIPPPSH